MIAATSLTQLAVFLAVAAIIAPLARRLGIGSALGYIFAGVLIGPHGIGLVFSVYEVQTILHIAEFGVVLLLFLIGLELRPRRFWAMRNAVFGVGAAQVLVTAALLTGAGLLLGLETPIALFLGIALSLSSTALALQVLDEKGELRARHGRVAFSSTRRASCARGTGGWLFPCCCFRTSRRSRPLPWCRCLPRPPSLRAISQF